MATCKCKVGRCPLCDSRCKRCGCACDGVNPEVALKRKRGAQTGGKRKIGDLSASHNPAERTSSKRPAKEAALTNIHTIIQTEQGENVLQETPEGMTIESIWTFFGFTEAQRKKLPSRKNAIEGGLEEKGPSWSTLVNRVLSAATRVAQVLYPGGIQELLNAVAHKILGTEPAEKRLEKAGTAIAKVVMKCKAASVQKRIARACLVKAFPLSVLQKLKEKNLLRLSSSSASQGYRDYNAMVAGEIIDKSTRHSIRYNEEYARTAVEFILLPDHVSKSWLTRQVHLTKNETVVVPVYVRRVRLKEMYKRYLTIVSQKEQVGRTSFYEICNAITTSDGCDFEVVEGCVQNQVPVLQNMIETFSTSENRREALCSDLDMLLSLLEAPHGRKVENEDPTHNISSHGPPGGTEGVDSVSDFFFDSLREEVRKGGRQERSINSALLALDEIQHKFKMHQRRRFRVSKQQDAIIQVEEDLKAECLANKRTSRAIVLIDWMKPRWKSVSWHGCKMTYYRYKQVDVVNAEGTCRKESVAERVNLYIDQILDGDNKQDVSAVASLIEAVLTHIHVQVPEITSVILQSGGARCYNTSYLPIFIALINSRSPLQVERHVVVELQDGEIDTHFGRAMTHVYKFMRISQRNRIHAIATAKGLAYALAWGGGVPNSSVQLVQVNREKLACLNHTLVTQCVQGLANKNIKGCSDTSFTKHIACKLVTLHDVQAAKDRKEQFELSMQAYSTNVLPLSTLTLLVGSDMVDSANWDSTKWDSTELEESGRESESESESENESESESESEDGTPFGNHHGEIHRRQDFIFNEEEATTGIVDVKKGQSIQVEDEGNEEESFQAPDSINPYGAVPMSEQESLTGIVVLKQCGFSSFKSTQHTSVQGIPRVSTSKQKDAARKDIIAFAVRLARDLVSKSDQDT